MGCSSSAPFATDGGALGEVKSVADDMIESGEHAIHDMGVVAGKAAHEAVEHVKGAISTAAGGVQSAVDHVGSMASNATHSISEGIRRETSVLTAPATPEPFPSNGSDPDACKHIPLKPPEDEQKKVNEMIKDIVKSTEQSPAPADTVPPLEKFKPTPVPSFDKPPTPGAGSPLDLMDKPMEKIDEVTATLDQLTDELLKETEAVASEVTAKVNETVKKELPPLKLPSMDSMKTDKAPLPPLQTQKSEIMSKMDSAMGEKIEDAKTEMTEAVDGVAETMKDEITEPATGDNPTDGNAEDLDVPPTKWEALADAIVELPPRMSIDLGTGQLYAVIVDDEPASRSSRFRSTVLREQASGESQAAKSAL